jgi:2-dehydro-3-deoxygluconokinase
MGFGGDTLNTAVYLSRLGAPTDYVTALGDDPYSDRMVASWQAEKVGTNRVIRRPGRLPGLYIIDIDERGERRFHYWRQSSPAREIFSIPETRTILAALAGYDYLYLSGISLSLYGEAGRAQLFGALDAARRRGGRIVFDSNYRPRNWPDLKTARATIAQMVPRMDIAVTGFEDEQALFGDANAGATIDRLRRAGVKEVVVKEAAAGAHLVMNGETILVPAERVSRVVDTTAAGDSFNAAYLAARIRGADCAAAARAGHRLAAEVIQHPGAIIPRDSMPPVFGDEESTVRRVRG